MSTLGLYFLLIIPQLKNLLGSLIFFSGFIFGGLTLFSSISYFADVMTWDEPNRPQRLEHKEHAVKWGKYLAGTTIPLSITSALIPTQKIMLILIAWYLGTGIEGITELPTEVVEYLRELLQNEVEKLKND